MGIILNRVCSHGELIVYRRKRAREWGLPAYVVGHEDGRMLQDFRTLRKACEWAGKNEKRGEGMMWYAKKGSAGAQGIVIDEDDGRTVAIAYDKKDTELLAAAPELLAVCKSLVAGGITGWSLKNYKAAIAAIAKAEGANT